MYLAVDIGGTKTLLAVFTDSGTLKQTQRFETPALYDEFLSELQDNFQKLPETTYKAAAAAVPGKVDRKQSTGIAFGNLAWQNVPLARDIQKIVNCPVKLENDANLAGLSEARLVPEYKRVLYVTISTGIGGVIITDGEIDPGTQDAEIGHILLEHGGKLTRWEDFASGKAITEHFGKKAREIDPKDSQAWYIVARNIAVGLIDAITTLTPDVVIIGGGVGSHFSKFGDRLVEQLKIYENSLITVPPVVQAKRPEEAVIYGCYELVRDL